jgi:enoyl-CoA hydratase/carnithine racemase
MTDEVLFERHGHLGLITLNRPQALNALNRPMCVAVHRQLDHWAADDAVRTVAIRGAGDRAFCAGGDVVAVARAGQAGSDEWEGFFADEYRMNHAIATYPKPYVALLDGITMGGGVGLSIHAPYRVTTEKFLFAMPETGIGLIPDVGGTHALPRLPGEIGTWLGLTGARLHATDAAYAGIGTHHVASNDIDALIAALSDGRVDAALAKFDASPGEATLDARRADIDRHFAHDSVEAIVASLESGSAWAQAQAATIAKMSPTSLKLTLAALRRGRSLDIGGCLVQEFALVCAIKRGRDFYEGIRAQLVDKDRNPKWSPGTLAGVSEADVEAAFAGPEGGGLLLP